MNLENRFFYRLVKVVYIFSLIMLFIISSFYLYDSIPSANIPDNERSLIICDNLDKFLLKTNNFTLEWYDTQLNYDDNKRAENMCALSSVRELLKIVASSTPSGKKMTENDLDKLSDESLAQIGGIKLKKSTSTPDPFKLDKNDKFQILRQGKNYSLKIVYKPKDWEKYFYNVLYGLFSAICFYCLLNVIRETLIYLAFGRKFLWDWIFISKKL